MSNTQSNNDYIQIPTIRWQIQTLRTDHELDGIAIWNAILNLRFPSTQGFIHPHIHNVWRGYPDMFTLELSHLNHSYRNPVLALYYQSADRHNENQWDRGQSELEGYLSARFGERIGDTLPIYGILAIGTKLKIFKYDGLSRSIERFVPPWDLERHHVQVWDMLGDINRIHNEGIPDVRGVANGSGRVVKTED